jgi:hypothetical protein
MKDLCSHNGQLLPFGGIPQGRKFEVLNTHSVEYLHQLRMDGVGVGAGSTSLPWRIALADGSYLIQTHLGHYIIFANEEEVMTDS